MIGFMVEWDCPIGTVRGRIMSVEGQLMTIEYGLEADRTIRHASTVRLVERRERQRSSRPGGRRRSDSPQTLTR